MQKLPKRRFTTEFRKEAIRLVIQLGQGVSETARQLQISPKTLEKWASNARKDSGNGARSSKPSVVSDLQMELSRLQAENARLKMEKEILKKAVLYSTGRRNA